MFNQSCLHMRTQVLSKKSMEVLKTSPEVKGKMTNNVPLFFNFEMSHHLPVLESTARC